jgi:hypothetical protein
MGLIDTTFGSIPASILGDWGQNLTYIKAGTDTYNTTTGTVTSTDTNIPVRALISNATPEEFEGFYQTNDIKIIIGAAELGNYYPGVRDRIQYTESSVTKVGRIISIKTYRGDSPILHTLLVRPQ